MAAPNNQEQLLLELINENRMNPMGAASRYLSSYSPLVSSDPMVQSALDYFAVSGNALELAFKTLLPTAPVAWNNQLADAATGHSQLMISFDQQSHQLPGEASVPSRAGNAGYNSSFVGECIYAYSQSMLYAMAGFMVDWGFDADGMQTPAGHRLNTMDSHFREIGLGVISDTSTATKVGPFVVTEDFGTRYQTSPEVFLLGVSYADLDGDRFYSAGEGRSGMNITTAGVSHQTSSSGGYTVELAAGARSISFSEGGLASPLVISTDLVSGTNAKIDVRDASTVLSSVSLTVISGVSEVVALGTNSLSIVGTGGHQLLHANNGGNTLSGLGGDDTLAGGAGNDILNGGAGLDTAVFSGTRASHTLTPTTTGWEVRSAADGTDILTNIEFLQFSDRTIDLSIPFDTTVPIIPTVLAFSPADGALQVPIGSTITLTFSENIVRGTGNIVLKTEDGLAVEIIGALNTTDISITGSVLTITPTRDLNYNTGYVVEFVADSIKDLDGNSFGGTTSYNFTTIASGPSSESTADLIQKNYIAFFSRPADSLGLAYWQGQLTNGKGIVEVQNGFSSSPEYQAIYQGKTPESLIDALYQNLFGRAAEADGLAWWANEMSTGRQTITSIAGALASGTTAGSPDNLAIMNKIAAATAFTKTLNDLAKNAIFSGLSATTKSGDWLKTVTSDAVSIATAETKIPDLLMTLGVSGTVSGNTIALDHASRTVNILSFNAEQTQKAITVTGFSGDKIDVSDFGFIGTQSGVTTKTGMTAAQTTADATFFAGKGVAIADIGGASHVYVDANKDGGFTPGIDIDVNLVGAHVTTANLSLFI